jgi:hypothetical protein
MQKTVLYILSLCVLGGLMSPSFVFSASTGFVQDTVSISDPTVLEGEQTQLQISFANHEDDNLQGKITFYNNDELLGSRDLDLASGETGNYSLDWEASFGEHSFIARAESLRLDGNSVTILGGENKTNLDGT